MPTSDLFFIGGIFGVGKSSLCEKVAHALRAEHVRASDLLQVAPSPPAQLHKAVSNVDENQARILSALAELRHQYGMIVLDGHYCLVDTRGAIVPVPIYVFETIRPQALVLVEADVNTVLRRLKERDGINYRHDVISELAAAEADQASVISLTLRLPLLVHSSSAGADEVVRFLISEAATES